MIRIPKRFYDDHVERDLEAPEIIKETKRHYYINKYPSDYLAELLSDAKYYSDCAGEGWNWVGYGGIGLAMQSSARATVKAIEAAQDNA